MKDCASADSALGVRRSEDLGSSWDQRSRAVLFWRRDLFWRRYWGLRALYSGFVAFREFKMYPLESDRRPPSRFHVASRGGRRSPMGLPLEPGRGSKLGRVHVRVVLVVDTLVRGTVTPTCSLIDCFQLGRNVRLEEGAVLDCDSHLGSGVGWIKLRLRPPNPRAIHQCRSVCFPRGKGGEVGVGTTRNPQQTKQSRVKLFLHWALSRSWWNGWDYMILLHSRAKSAKSKNLASG